MSRILSARGFIFVVHHFCWDKLEEMSQQANLQHLCMTERTKHRNRETPSVGGARGTLIVLGLIRVDPHGIGLAVQQGVQSILLGRSGPVEGLQKKVGDAVYHLRLKNH